ncbi:MAG: AraC family transcriptional regulator [Burkholderiaceae bacterium]|nr:AraC family transcriptional regulator [Burkholderiaceae bacterium]
MSSLTQRLRRVFFYADNNLAGDLSLATAAARAHWSPHHFHRIFLSHTGAPWGRFVRRRRLDEAVALLLDTPLPASVIGARVGYRSPSAFSAAFVEEFAVTPMQVRRSGGQALAPIDRPNVPPAGAAWQFALIEQPALLLVGHRLRCRQRLGFADAARQAWRALDAACIRPPTARIGLLDGLVTPAPADDRRAIEPAYTAAAPSANADHAARPAGTPTLGRVVAAGSYATVDWQGPLWMLAYAWHRLLCAVEGAESLRLRADSAIEFMTTESAPSAGRPGTARNAHRLMLPVEREVDCALAEARTASHAAGARPRMTRVNAG